MVHLYLNVCAEEGIWQEVAWQTDYTFFVDVVGVPFLGAGEACKVTGAGRQERVGAALGSNRLGQATRGRGKAS